jgi:hypothetical protein
VATSAVNIAVYRYLPGGDNLDGEAIRSVQFVRSERKKALTEEMRLG